MSGNSILSSAALRAADQAIGYLMKEGLEHPDCLSLAAGVVDESTLRTELAQQAATRVLTPDPSGRSALQYGTTAGVEPLRSVFRAHLAKLEDNSEVNELPLERVMLTTGSQQLLCLLTQALFNPGDICLVSAPTYFVYLGVLDAVGAEVIPVPSDGGGMQLEALQHIFESLESEGRLDRVRLVYAVSYYDNPAGVSIAAERREPLVKMVQEWAEKCPVRLLEDAAYRELRYDGPVLPSLWSCDQTSETVILTQTFSKSFSPGLRVGFSVLPQSLVKPVSDLKGNEDFGSARLNQHLLADVLDSGAYPEHVHSVCESYSAKRDAMLAAADEFFAEIDGVTWERPAGGLYVWMSLPEKIATGFDSPLFERAANTEKVMYVPGELCYPSGWGQRPRHQMRLSYGVLPPNQIREGMRRLAAAVRHITESVQ